MAIILGAAAPGRIVKPNRNGKPVNFYVYQHGLERTVLVQERVEDLPRSIGSQNGYINGPADAYLNGEYVAGFDASVIAALPNTIQYEYKQDPSKFGGTVLTASAVRSAYLLTSDDYTSGVFPAIAKDSTDTARVYWTQSIYASAYNVQYYAISTSGDDSNYGNSSSYYIRPAISLPNSVIVEDDGTIIIPGQDSLKILPCIKY